SISLICATMGRSFLTSRSFFEPMIFLMMYPIMRTVSKQVGNGTGSAGGRQKELGCWQGLGRSRRLGPGAPARGGVGRRGRRQRQSAEAAPDAERHEAERDESELAADEEHEPLERGGRESVAVQSDLEQVHAEP